MDSYCIVLSILAFGIILQMFIHSSFHLTDSIIVQYSFDTYGMNSYLLLHAKKDKYRIYNESSLPYKTVETISFLDSKIHINTIVLTTCANVSKKFKNVLSSLQFFKEEYGIKSIVFSNSSSVQEICHQKGILTNPLQEVNPFGLPILKSMLLFVKKHYPGYSYMYINSDILVNPNVLVLSHYLQNKLPNPMLIVGRVFNTITIPDLKEGVNRSTYAYLHPLIRNRRWITEIDYFIFSSDYPFESLGAVVIGRWCVDSEVLRHAHSLHIEIVDTSSIISYHQGIDTSKSISTLYTEDDWTWNYRIFNFGELFFNGCLTSNYVVVLPKDNSPITLFSTEYSFYTSILPILNNKMDYNRWS